MAATPRKKTFKEFNATHTLRNRWGKPCEPTRGVRTGKSVLLASVTRRRLLRTTSHTVGGTAAGCRGAVRCTC